MIYSIILQKINLLEKCILGVIPTNHQENIFLLDIIVIIFTKPKVMFILFSSGFKNTQWSESQNLICDFHS